MNKRFSEIVWKLEGKKKKDAEERVKKKEKGILVREVTHKTTLLKKKKKKKSFPVPWTLVVKFCHVVGDCDRGTEIPFAFLKSKKQEIQKIN